MEQDRKPPPPQAMSTLAEDPRGRQMHRCVMCGRWWPTLLDRTRCEFTDSGVYALHKRDGGEAGR